MVDGFSRRIASARSTAISIVNYQQYAHPRPHFRWFRAAKHRFTRGFIGEGIQ
jgi:hypothetical protein